MVGLLIGGASTFAAIQVFNGSPKFYSDVIMPVLQKTIDAETAHHLSVKFLSSTPFLIRNNSAEEEPLLVGGIYLKKYNFMLRINSNNYSHKMVRFLLFFISSL